MTAHATSMSMSHPVAKVDIVSLYAFVAELTHGDGQESQHATLRSAMPLRLVATPYMCIGSLCRISLLCFLRYRFWLFRYRNAMPAGQSTAELACRSIK